MSIAWIIVQIVVGVVLLALGADRFIAASAALARNFKLPTLLVGILLVGFGTSFPELVVSAIAAFHNKSQIAIGNVIGSNIANIGLVLGLATLILPINVHSRLIKREFPILIIISILAGVLLWNGYLSRFDGIILLVILALHIYWVSVSIPKSGDILFEEVKEHEAEKPVKMKTSIAIVWWVIGLGLLFLSSDLLVNGAVGAAKLIGISDLVIGLTIVTIGTSLPEFAATITSALKKEHDIAIGGSLKTQSTIDSYASIIELFRKLVGIID
ncbi:calcium/sodium antiporter [Candidiatus Paracoxiella cheracis]|uniref:calcium/sodium antiporter n=1 Tax=Candidiatus Paracoxiella cheracis TaxID=3405120 RepID=UPI003BF550F7